MDALMMAACTMRALRVFLSERWDQPGDAALSTDRAEFRQLPFVHHK
jgi:hypothetical protein